MKTAKYPSINGLRAISIVFVLMNHLWLDNIQFKELVEIIWIKPLAQILIDGQLGVNVFFVISGFLITSLMLKEEKIANTISLKKFYLRRILRIFPAYYSLLLIYFFLQILGYLEISKESWLTALTLTKYFNLNLDWITNHAWSLSIEEHFYILWPLVFINGKILRKRIAFFLILFVPVLRGYLYFYPIEWMGELTIFQRIDGIAIGCLFALNKDEILKKINGYWNTIFYLSLITLLLLPYFPAIANKLHLAFLFIPLGLTHGTIANIVVALIMMYSVFGPKGIWYKMLNLKWINYIGILSYSIYLWQQIFVLRTKYWATHFPQNIFIIFLVAMLSYHFIEKPFLKLKTKFAV